MQKATTSSHKNETKSLRLSPQEEKVREFEGGGRASESTHRLITSRTRDSLM